MNSGNRITEEMRAREGGWACQGASPVIALVGSFFFGGILIAATTGDFFRVNKSGKGEKCFLKRRLVQGARGGQP